MIGPILAAVLGVIAIIGYSIAAVWHIVNAYRYIKRKDK